MNFQNRLTVVNEVIAKIWHHVICGDTVYIFPEVKIANDDEARVCYRHFSG